MDPPEAHHHAHHHRGNVFAFGINSGPLIFSFWEPTTAVSYFTSLVLIFSFACGVEWLSAAHRLRDEQFHSRRLASPSVSPSEQLRVCIGYAASISMHYALMLLVMTFNFGVCVAVVCGLAVGRMHAQMNFSHSYTRDEALRPIGSEPLDTS